MSTLRLLGLAALSLSLALSQQSAFAQSYYPNQGYNYPGQNYNYPGQSYYPSQVVSPTLSLTASTAIAQADEPFVYTVVVTNPGGTELKNTDVLLTIDSDLKVESVTQGGTAGNNARWRLTLPAHGSLTLQATVRPKKNVPDHGILTTVAAALGANATSQLPVYNEDTSETIDDKLVKVELFPSRPDVQPGETFEYCVQLTNLNWKKLPITNLELELDNRLEVLSSNNNGHASGNHVVWSDLLILGQNSRQLKVSVRVKSTAKNGDLLESFATSEGITAHSTTHVTDLDENREPMTIFAYPTISAAQIGEEIPYIINIENRAGVGDRLDVVAYIDSRTQFVTASDNALLLEKHTVRWDDILLDSHGTKTLTLLVRVLDRVDSLDPIGLTVVAGTCRVQDQLVFDLEDSIPAGSTSSSSTSSTSSTSSQSSTSSSRFSFFHSSNSSSSSSDSSQPQVGQLEFTAEPTKAEVAPGSIVSLTLRAENTGNGPLSNISVRLQLPREGVMIVDPAEGEAGFQSLRWAIPTLEAGATWEKTVTAEIPMNALNGKQFTFLSSGQASAQVAQTAISTFGVQTLAPQAGAEQTRLQAMIVPMAHAAVTTSDSEWTVHRIGEISSDDSNKSVGWIALHVSFWIAAMLVIVGIALRFFLRYLQ